MASTKATGDIGEQLAAEYLERQGYTILERNAKYAGCEADIICCCEVKPDGTIVKPKKQNGLFSKLFGKHKSGSSQNRNTNRVTVFCEVKTRTGGEYGEAIEAVDAYKIGRYVTLAKAYAARYFTANEDIRFDVIEVGQDGEINHVENAFTANDARYPRKSF
ncbi:MAG: YraN family protein [Clostridia bacterium]|nr:YraN family protein [Clostridia bacterium]